MTQEEAERRQTNESNRSEPVTVSQAERSRQNSRGKELGPSTSLGVAAGDAIQSQDFSSPSSNTHAQTNAHAKDLTSLGLSSPPSAIDRERSPPGSPVAVERTMAKAQKQVNKETALGGAREARRRSEEEKPNRTLLTAEDGDRTLLPAVSEEDPGREVSPVPSRGREGGSMSVGKGERRGGEVDGGDERRLGDDIDEEEEEEEALPPVLRPSSKDKEERKREGIRLVSASTKRDSAEHEHEDRNLSKEERVDGYHPIGAGEAFERTQYTVTEQEGWREWMCLDGNKESRQDGEKRWSEKESEGGGVDAQRQVLKDGEREDRREGKDVSVREKPPRLGSGLIPHMSPLDEKGGLGEIMGSFSEPERR